MPERDHEELAPMQFDALINVLKMFVLLAVPEPRRTDCLGLVRRMVESHSSDLNDPLQDFDQEMLLAIDGLFDLAMRLSAFERLVDDLPSCDLPDHQRKGHDSRR